MESSAVGRDGQRARAIENEWRETASLIQRKMRDGSYAFTPYREVLISKGPRSLPRVVSVPTARDRIVLKALATVVKEIFPDASTPMAQVKVGELIGALARSDYDSYVRVDVKNFYPTVSHRAVLSQLRKRVRQTQLLTLLVRAMSTPTASSRSPRPNFSNLVGVPQGLSVSNLLAEIAMRDIDEFFRSRRDIAYFRYVDDVLILCRGADATTIFEDVAKRSKAIGLAVHELGEGSKSQVGSLDDTFEYLGYEFCKSSVSVRSASVQKLEATIAQLFTSYKYQLGKSREKDWPEKCRTALLRRLDLVIAGCVFENIPRGWIQYFLR